MLRLALALSLALGAATTATAATGVAFVHGTGKQTNALNDYWGADFVNSVRQGLPDQSKYVVINCDFEQYMWDSRAAGCLAGLFAVLGWLTYRQAGKWHDTITLFEDAVADTRRNWQAHRILADHYLNRGDYRRTISHCRQASGYGREMDRVLGTYGRALFELGSTAEAIEKLEQATPLAPDKPLAMNW